MLDTWAGVAKICFIMVIGTSCVTVFMMLTANNPSADDFWRGVGSFGIGIGSMLAHRYFKGKS